jgi:ribonuclease HII
VVAAAVILDDKKRILGVNDSKVLTPLQRDRLYDKIREKALCCSVGMASVLEIDEINIFHATMLAMKRAVEGLRLKPVKVLVDGNRLPKWEILSEAIVDGDAKIKSISAASIIAKVTRDRMLVELHQQFPQYGFAAHKGYSTPEHLEALRKHGPCVHHRRHFAPVAAQFATREGVTVSVQVS